MWKRRTEPDESGPNLLDLRPRHGLEWEAIDGGRVVLLVPKFTHPFWVRHLMPRLRKPYIRVKLDDYGSHLWLHCDGEATVEAIGEAMKARFGDSVEPLYERMATFILRLEKEKWLVLDRETEVGQ